jgi:hypothetical protein
MKRVMLIARKKGNCKSIAKVIVRSILDVNCICIELFLSILKERLHCHIDIEHRYDSKGGERKTLIV